LTAPRLAPITCAALVDPAERGLLVMMNVLIRVAAQSIHPFEVAFSAASSVSF
jgi:hypothetical protein